MKRNILYIAGLTLLGMTATSCDDYLEVDSPSKFTDEYVFSNTDEANRLLNSVYASVASNSTFGGSLLTTFCLNSDVDFTVSSNEIQSASHNEYKLFDCEADASNLLTLWTALYSSIERANNFVDGAENSALYEDGTNDDLNQQIGEAKCLRAMNYLELVNLFGDVPFSMTRTYDSESLVMPMAKREDILTTLINDLKETAPKMQYSASLSAGIERCSKEFCWAMIARMSLFRAGYSLHPGTTPSDEGVMTRPDDYKEYYKIARDYCDSVIVSGTHALTKNFHQVFIDECNYKVAIADDPIFEIPFTMNISGGIGYYQGPSGSDSNAGGTEGLNQWGTASGSATLNAFYRFSFDEQDVRRNTIGFWSYSYDGTPNIRTSYTDFNNKWSKFWDENHTLGYQSSSNTGINFPYMRYADVLLMFAEAENELNDGPTADAKSALKTVRERAFRGATNSGAKVDSYVDAASSKDAFFQLIFDERKWEFAGENIRWKDLVRWNLYNQVIYKTFWYYYGVGSDDYSYDIYDEYDNYPKDIYYKQIDNPGDGSYPNNVLPVLTFFTDSEYGVDNLWKNLGSYPSEHTDRMPLTTGDDAWNTTKFFNWIDDNTGIAKAQCRCSLRGYIYINEEGTLEPASMPIYDGDVNLNNLPVVRYILPIPSDAISRSKGTYQNYYGY